MIRDLAEGRSRFCELERSLAGISPRTLSLRLRGARGAGHRRAPHLPRGAAARRVLAHDKGEALVPLIDDMRRYGREWLGVERLRCHAGGRRAPSPSRAAA